MSENVYPQFATNNEAKATFAGDGTLRVEGTLTVWLDGQGHMALDKVVVRDNVGDMTIESLTLDEASWSDVVDGHAERTIGFVATRADAPTCHPSVTLTAEVTLFTPLEMPYPIYANITTSVACPNPGDCVNAFDELGIPRAWEVSLQDPSIADLAVDPTGALWVSGADTSGPILFRVMPQGAISQPIALPTISHIATTQAPGVAVVSRVDDTTAVVRFVGANLGTEWSVTLAAAPATHPAAPPELVIGGNASSVLVGVSGTNGLVVNGSTIDPVPGDYLVLLDAATGNLVGYSKGDPLEAVESFPDGAFALSRTELASSKKSVSVVEPNLIDRWSLTPVASFGRALIATGDDESTLWMGTNQQWKFDTNGVGIYLASAPLNPTSVAWLPDGGALFAADTYGVGRLGADGEVNRFAAPIDDCPGSREVLFATAGTQPAYAVRYKGKQGVMTRRVGRLAP